MYRRIIIGLAAIGLLTFSSVAFADYPYQEIQATIMKMQPQANQVTVQTENGKETTFVVNDATWLQAQGSTPFDGKLEDFKQGMRVTILFRAEPQSGKPQAVLMYPAKENR